MYTKTDRKIDNLSKEEKGNFYSELEKTLDSNTPTIENIEEAKEKLYQRMFEKHENK
jgi:hypothetical protein